MLKNTRKILFLCLISCNAFVAFMYLFTAYSGHFNPSNYPFLAVVGLSFPIFLILNICFILFWTFFKRRYILVSFAALVLCAGPTLKYMPLHFSDEHPDDCIKVLSYNTMAFNQKTAEKGEANGILSYIIDSKADVICIQEYSECEEKYKAQWDSIHSIYQHSDTIHSRGDGDVIAVFSKYPVTSSYHIDFESKGNVAGVFEIKVGNKKVYMVNCHLETVGLSVEEKDYFEKIVKGDADRHEAKADSKLLLTKLKGSMATRAPQARAVAEFISKHKGESIILCGDFNDHPLSYTNRVISENLIDCYEESGFLPGFSFCYNSMYVRIDNIMCSNDWTPYACKVDKSISLSDHYPIYCYLKAEK